MTKASDFYHSKVVIDSSVLLKAFLNEEGSEQVSQLLAMHKQNECTLLAPKLLLFEFMNIINRIITKEKQVKTAIKLFESIDIALLDLDSQSIFEASKRVHKKSKSSFYDSSFHALAKTLSATFLTADLQYFNAHKDEGNIALFSTSESKE